MSVWAKRLGRHELPLGRIPTIAVVCVLGVAAVAVAAAVLGPYALGLPLAAIVAIALLREPLVIFVGFLYVGVFKDEALLQALPGDATLALGLLLGGVCTYRVASARARRPPLPFALLLGLFAVALGLGLLWTPVPDYGQDKFLKFALFTALAALAPFALVEDRRDLRRLVGFLGAAAVAGGLFALLFGTTSVTDQTGDRLVVGGATNTIYTSRFLVTGALVLLLAPALGVWHRHRAMTALCGAGLVAISAGIGSRGPLLAAALAAVCTIVAVVVRQPRRLFPVMLVIAAGIAVFPFVSLPETSSERLADFTENPTAALQEDSRDVLYDRAIEITNDHPAFGIGTGGFALYSGVISTGGELYPHNIFLEAAAELGLLPPLALAVAIIALLVALYRRAWDEVEDGDRNLIYLVGGIFLLNLFATQFSGDFNDNRTFWAAFGLAWLVARYGVPLNPPPAGADGNRVGRL